MNPRKLTTIGILSSIAFSMLACTIFLGGPDYPNQAIPISTEAVGELEKTIEQALIAGAVSGQVILSIAEPQITSYVSMRLQQQTDPFITNPQVYLRDGQIQVFGTAQQGYFQTTSSIILTAGVDDGGLLKIELTSADFGPLPVPEGFLSAITAILEEAFTGALGPVATGIRLTGISIAEGVMTVTGQIK